MSEEFRKRQQAVRLRLAGKSVSFICEKIGHCKSWFYKWWQRYLEQGANGLKDASRAPKSSPHQIADEVRQAILKIRDRLTKRGGPKARYRLAGAPTILLELENLGYDPLPSLRTVERILQQEHRTCPSFQVQPTSMAVAYPGPRATASNQVHQLDLVGPRYLKGSSTSYYFLVYKDAYDQTPYIEFQPEPNMDFVLAFLVRAWQRFGLPRYLQVDNGRLFAGTGRWPGSISRFIRLALLVGVEIVFIPEGEPFRNGSAENFNGWFQERLLAIPLHSPAQVRRELKAMMEVCFQENVHAHLGFRTSQQVRHSLQPRRLPANFDQHLRPMPLAVGKITFIRKVRTSGCIPILGVKVQVGKRRKGRYVRAVLYTRTRMLKIYDHTNKLIKQIDYPIRGAEK